MRVKDISFGYSSDKILLNDLSFNVQKGDKICVIGKNGKGKSTLLKLLSKEINILNGEIGVHEKVKIGYFGQMNIDRLNNKNSIYEEIQSVDPSIPETRVRTICAHMMFPGKSSNKKIGVLSGGERSRVTLGRILLNPVNLLFLDEPTNHLDMESTETLMEAVQIFEGSVIMVTHDEYFLKKIANKLIIYDEGKAFFYNGDYRDFQKKIGWKDV
jgi:ATP-binding cassette subfamily F protein 3